MTDRNKLLGAAYAHGQDLADVARICGCHRSSLSRKLSPDAPECFTQAEIKSLVDAWRLTPAEVTEIFFSGGVSQAETGILA